MEAARDDAERRLEQRRIALPNTEEIVEYVADFRDFLKDGTYPERKALIRNFVEGIEGDGRRGDADEMASQSGQASLEGSASRRPP